MEWFDKQVTLKHLTEGEEINPLLYVEKLKTFKALGIEGTYVVRKNYQTHSEKGFLYFKLDTLIKYFGTFKTEKLIIKCGTKGLCCQ